MDATFWNERYAKEAYAYGEAPNTFFARTLRNYPPGRLLLPLEGEGRNAVFAASEGWVVDAFDYSVAGKDKALSLAQKVAVTIQYTVSEVTKYPFAAEAYDAIGLCYAHLSPPDRSYLHQQASNALRPGGHLILEAFRPAQLSYHSGGPRNAEWLYTPEMLTLDFPGLEFLTLETPIIDLAEGQFHCGEAAVIRLIAQKPA
ncbi:MAG: class I SAM-dependent methyltransferase [Lewinellaceae bacterium]|nr:class I SAM-dependent methyltransferase [Lewinellaceae bacterium]